MMVIDLDTMRRFLPYELHAMITLRSQQPNAVLSMTTGYVESYLSGVLSGTGTLASPQYSKEFVLPLPYLDRRKEIQIIFARVGLVQNALGQKTSLTIRLGEITAEKRMNKQYTLFEDKNIFVQVDFRIVENELFKVRNHELLDEQDVPVLSEEKLSQRLKQKIIMLSLGLGSNCNGLIKEITNILTDAQPIVNDVDLMEILDDVNGVQGKNEFEKVIAMLKDADKEDRALLAANYPRSVPFFQKYISMMVYEIYKSQSHHNNKVNFYNVQKILGSYKNNLTWHEKQPIFHEPWLREKLSQWEGMFLTGGEKGVLTSSYEKGVFFSVRLFLRHHDLKEIFLSTSKYSDYLNLLKLLAIVKNYQSGIYNKQSIIQDMKLVELFLCAQGIVMDEELVVQVEVDFMQECLVFGACCSGGGESGQEEELMVILEEIFPLFIPFEQVRFILLLVFTGVRILCCVVCIVLHYSYTNLFCR